MAEFPLYVKTNAIISHILSKYTNNPNQNFLDDFPKSIKKLWIDLYEYGFVEIEDVNSVILWLEALSSVGYEFPGKSTSGKTKEISEEHEAFLFGGNDLYTLSKKYITKHYNGLTYLKSTCIKNKAGNNFKKYYFVLNLKFLSKVD